MALCICVHESERSRFMYAQVTGGEHVRGRLANRECGYTYTSVCRFFKVCVVVETRLFLIRNLRGFAAFCIVKCFKVGRVVGK